MTVSCNTALFSHSKNSCFHYWISFTKQLFTLQHDRTTLLGVANRAVQAQNIKQSTTNIIIVTYTQNNSDRITLKVFIGAGTLSPSTKICHLRRILSFFNSGIHAMYLGGLHLSCTTPSLTYTSQLPFVFLPCL